MERKFKIILTFAYQRSTIGSMEKKSAAEPVGIGPAHIRLSISTICIVCLYDMALFSFAGPCPIMFCHVIIKSDPVIMRYHLFRVFRYYDKFI